jgi:3-methyladenine DNA glycosylase AlkD
MPLDPTRLRARAAEAAAKLVSPPECAAAIHKLLADHADLTRRTSLKTPDSAPANELKTPVPVLRAVVAALRKPAQAAPDDTLALAKALWAAGSREERHIAAELLGLIAPQMPGEVWALIEAWLPELESGETAETLAREAFAPLMLADTFTSLQKVHHWLIQPNRWLRRFGLAALSALTKDRQWDDVPAALDVLRAAMAEPEPMVRQAVSETLIDLLPRGQAEVVRFMLEQAARPDHNTHLILRATLRHLPEDAQAELVRVMRA